MASSLRYNFFKACTQEKSKNGRWDSSEGSCVMLHNVQARTCARTPNLLCFCACFHFSVHTLAISIPSYTQLTLQSHASCLPIPLHSHPTPRDGAESHVAYAVIDLWTAGCPGAGTMQASRLPRPLEQRLVWDYRQLLLYACLILRSRRPPTAISTTVLTLSRKDSPSALLGDRFRRSF